MPHIAEYGRNVQLKELEEKWGALYPSVLNILGSTGTILPIGDPLHGQPTATTFTTVGGEQVTFTWSKAPTGFDEGLDITSPDSFQGIVPVVDFDGVDEEADSPDAAYWTRALAVFSVGAWVKLTDATNSVILAKYEATGNQREWIFGTSGDALRLYLADENDVGDSAILTVANANLTEGIWIFVAATYDGSANATGINLYQDGAVVASTDTDQAGFVSMRDGTSTVQLGHQNLTPANLFDGKMAGGPLGPFFVQKELAADEILQLYEIGRRALAL